jgi:hypothetical protein
MLTHGCRKALDASTTKDFEQITFDTVTMKCTFTTDNVALLRTEPTKYLAVTFDLALKLIMNEGGSTIKCDLISQVSDAVLMPFVGH